MLFLEKRQEKLEIHRLLLPHRGDGVVHDVKVYTKDDNDDLPSGVSMVVRVYIIQRERFKLEIKWVSSRK